MQKQQVNTSLNELQFFIHDIKSPLTNLSINLESLRIQLKDMPTDYEQSINSALRSLDYINNYVLTYKNNFKNNHVWFNAKSEIEYLITSHFNTNFNQYNISFRISSSGEELIFGDKFDFRRLIFNLLNNACEALQDSQIKLKRIQASVSRRADFMVIKIVDNGPGIIDCSNVFNPGYTTKENHLGIGLDLVTQIVREFNGKITVTSQPYNSTCFKLTLPILNH